MMAARRWCRPYSGAAQAVTDLLGADAVMFSAAQPSCNMWNRQLKALASSERSALGAPDLPTVAGGGLPGFDTSVCLGFHGPHGLIARGYRKTLACDRRSAWNDEVTKPLPRGARYQGRNAGSVRRVYRQRNNKVERRRQAAAFGLISNMKSGKI